MQSLPIFVSNYVILREEDAMSIMRCVLARKFYVSIEVKARYLDSIFRGRVPAGFPSPAEDYLETPLDLSEYLIETRRRRS